MQRLILMAMFSLALSAWAQDEVPLDIDREPAALPSHGKKRGYPGGADEEDLKVLTVLPEASQKTDARSLQREVFKALYNQELKDDRADTVEE